VDYSALLVFAARMHFGSSNDATESGNEFSCTPNWDWIFLAQFEHLGIEKPCGFHPEQKYLASCNVGTAG